MHIVVSDDVAVEEVLASAEQGLAKGAIIIDHTTTTVEGAIKRTEHWKAKGFTYVHVPVFMGPANALDGTGYMLISGDQSVAQQIMPWLQTMTGQVLNYGDTTGKAAGVKLIGNLFLLALTGGISDMLSLGSAVGVTGQDIATLFDAWNPGASTPARLHRVLKNNFDHPSWELQMARKDARLMIQEAARGGKTIPATEAIAIQMDECDLTQEEVAERMKKDRSTVTNYLRLLRLPPDIQKSVRDGELSMGHARAIIGLEQIDLQLYVFREVKEKGLSDSNILSSFLILVILFFCKISFARFR